MLRGHLGLTDSMVELWGGSNGEMVAVTSDQSGGQKQWQQQQQLNLNQKHGECSNISTSLSGSCCFCFCFGGSIQLLINSSKCCTVGICECSVSPGQLMHRVSGYKQIVVSQGAIYLACSAPIQLYFIIFRTNRGACTATTKVSLGIIKRIVRQRGKECPRENVPVLCVWGWLVLVHIFQLCSQM